MPSVATAVPIVREGTAAGVGLPCAVVAPAGLASVVAGTCTVVCGAAVGVTSADDVAAGGMPAPVESLVPMKKLDHAATAASSSSNMPVRIRPRYLGLPLTGTSLLPSPKPGLAVERRAAASCASGLAAVGRGTTLRSRRAPRMPGAVTKAPPGLPDLLIAGLGPVVCAPEDAPVGAVEDRIGNGTVSRVPIPAAGRAMLGRGTVGRGPLGAGSTEGALLTGGAAAALVVPAVAAAMAAVRRLAKAATISAAGEGGMSSSLPIGSGATSMAIGASGTGISTFGSAGLGSAGLGSAGLRSATCRSGWFGNALSSGQDGTEGAGLRGDSGFRMGADSMSVEKADRATGGVVGKAPEGGKGLGGIWSATDGREGSGSALTDAASSGPESNGPAGQDAASDRGALTGVGSIAGFASTTGVRGGSGTGAKRSAGSGSPFGAATFSKAASGARRGGGATGSERGKSRAMTVTGSGSRSTFSPSASRVAAAAVGPKNGSPRKAPFSGTPTKLTGLKRCSVAKASASAKVSFATTATCSSAPVPHQS